MRAYLLEKFYELSTWPYQKVFKTRAEAWNLTIWELIHFEEGTLGFDLGVFLQQNGFTPQDKLESHDVFHVLTSSGVAVPEEVSMQFYLYGNGKKSAYLFMVMAVGALFYPDEIERFKYAYNKGQESRPFHQLNFRDLLTTKTRVIRSKYCIKSNNYKPLNLSVKDSLLVEIKSLK